MTHTICMKIASRTIAITAVLFLTLSTFGYFLWKNPQFKPAADNQPFSLNPKKEEPGSITTARLRQKSLLAKEFVKSHAYDNEICFLIDMRVPSGKNRFFVYNLNNDFVEAAGLVTHGSGSDNGSNELLFSNTPNSYCTSLGKYKIGKSYNGRFGLAYKLYGLDTSNSKAFDRFVVLHGHECVPDNEIAPQQICLSQGCPTVAPAFLTQLKTYIDKAAQPVLLLIYH